VHEPDDVPPGGQADQRVADRLDLIGVHEVEERPRQQFVRREAERPPERRVDAVHAAIQASDEPQVERALEELLEHVTRSSPRSHAHSFPPASGRTTRRPSRPTG
jgi:thioredoxin-like negative regulator of GroEL